MSANDKMLWLFSATFIVVMATMLVVPILRRKADYLNTWNAFLIGSIIFTGLSGFNSIQRGHYSASYRATDYYLYFLGVIAFWGAASFAYYFWKYPRRLAGRHLLRWPQLTGWVLVILTVVLSLMGLFSRFQLPIPFVGQLLFQFGVSTPLLAFACAFIAWYRQPANPLLVALLLAVGAFTVVTSLGLGSTRRVFMSAIAVPPICLYWVWLRYKPTTTILVWVLAALFVGVPMLKALSAVRSIGKYGPSISPMQRAVLMLKAMPKEILSGGSSEGFMGQDSVESALLTIHLLNDNSERLEVAPFHSAIYILVNPIPRSMWEGKPIGLGITLPQVARFDKRGITANLGINVAGQCYYDGGLLVHVLYGLIVGGFFRFYDELLVRQPGNPLLIGGLVYMTPQILGLPRGGLETMGLQIFLGFVTVVLTAWVSRLVFGSGIVYPRTDHLVDYPVLRSPSDWARWMGSYTGVAPAARPRDDEYDFEAAPLRAAAR